MKIQTLIDRGLEDIKNFKGKKERHNKDFILIVDTDTTGTITSKDTGMTMAFNGQELFCLHNLMRIGKYEKWNVDCINLCEFIYSSMGKYSPYGDGRYV